MVIMISPIDLLYVVYVFYGILMAFYIISDCFYNIPYGLVSDIKNLLYYSLWVLKIFYL